MRRDAAFAVAHLVVRLDAAWQDFERAGDNVTVTCGMSDTVLRVVRANVREPVQVEGDLYALVACNEIGGRRLLAMMNEYKLQGIEKLGEHAATTSGQ